MYEHESTAVDCTRERRYIDRKKHELEVGTEAPGLLRWLGRNHSGGSYTREQGSPALRSRW